MNYRRNHIKFILFLVCCACCHSMTIGDMSEHLTSSFRQIGQLMIGVAYVAGIGFGISSIFKFKQHKDNPTQIPIGTPFALLGVSVMLVFLPGLYAPAGETVFGSGSELAAGGFEGGGALHMPGSDYGVVYST